VDDGVGGVEVAVGEPVAHPGDLGPGQIRLGGQQDCRHAFDRFAYLDQADPDGVLDQPVGKATPRQVVVDGVQRSLDDVEPLPDPAAHSGTASSSTSPATPDLRSLAGTTSTFASRISDRSRSRAASPSSPVPDARSTSGSTSLSTVPAHRATEPKTRKFDAPREEAARFRAPRCCTTRRPSGPVNRAWPGPVCAPRWPAPVRWRPPAAPKSVVTADVLRTRRR